MSEFIDDDEGFLRWRDTHLDGYVLNTSRNRTASYRMVHRATCRQLRRNDARQQHQTRDYIKVCALAIADLQRWVNRHVSGHAELRPCRQCKP